MAMQTPEPEYYTLAEVAERWGKSEDFLLRLIKEGKLLAALPVRFAVSVRAEDHDLETLSEDEIKRILPEGVFISPEITQEQYYKERTEREVKYKMIAAEHGDDWADRIKRHDDLFPLPLPSNAKVIIDGIGYLLPDCLCEPDDKDPEKHPAWFSGASHFCGLEGKTPGVRWDRNYYLDDLETTFTTDAIVIPTSEIHRIEHQREAAEQATADDVLGTRERETMQAVIAAMAQFIAGTATKYKRNERPNVDAISEALKATIPNRTKRGISETISRALKAGLIRT